jgi:hypothetical protein
MNDESHPRRDQLISFVEGDLPLERTREIESHIAGCKACRAYVESLCHTFVALETDLVPEPPETFFTYLAGRTMARVSGSRRRLVFTLAPGLAAAAAVVILMWYLTGVTISPVDSVEIIMADMTTGEIVEALSTDPYAGSLLVEDSEDDLSEVEMYLLETESIHDLLDSMSDTERERFMDHLKGSMTRDGGTSGLVTDFARKEC